MNDTAPVSGPQKEQAPIGPISYVEKVEKQPEIPPEVGQVGVQPVSQQVVLKKEDLEAGLAPAKEEVPITESLSNLPLTEQEAKTTLGKHKNIRDAIVWLATFVIRQFKIHKLKSGGQ